MEVAHIVSCTLTIQWHLETHSTTKGKTIDGYMWIFTVRYNPDGRVERLKACLVAKGYWQLYGVFNFPGNQPRLATFPIEDEECILE